MSVELFKHVIRFDIETGSKKEPANYNMLLAA